MSIKSHLDIYVSGLERLAGFTWEVPHVTTPDVINDLQLVVQHHVRDPVFPLPRLQNVVLVGQPPDVLRVVLDGLKERYLSSVS